MKAPKTSKHTTNAPLLAIDKAALPPFLALSVGRVLFVAPPPLPPRPDPTHNTQFIANGAFCGVYACKYRGWNVVAKRVRHDLPLQERKTALANLWTEYDCLRKLSHPNIIDVYGMW